MNNRELEINDLIIKEAIANEFDRQKNSIELIASENFVSQAVMDIAGSVLTNKYAEGYPGKRYYGGCQYVDVVEQVAIDRLKELFGAEHANVQPHSGSQANAAVYMSVLDHGDKVLGMDLNHGGHLTHGHPLSFSGIDYTFYSYGVTQDEEIIDYDEVERIAVEVQPKMIVAGASAYSRSIDFKRFREIADKVGAYLFVDMAHIAGLIIAGEHQNPVPYADFVSSTTHKTMRGPRGGIVLCKAEHAKALDRAVFPGTQGGPLMHIIAAKAVAFGEALQPEFTTYQQAVAANAKAMAARFAELGAKVVSGGTDNHLMTVDVKTTYGLTGKVAEHILDGINITLNKNTIPFDTEKPFVTSGIRFGTPAMTTRGFSKETFIQVVDIMDAALKNPEDTALHAELKEQVLAILQDTPYYEV